MPAANVQQATIGPWNFALEGAGIGSPPYALQKLTGIPPTFSAEFQYFGGNSGGLLPYKLSAFVQPIPYTGIRWVATSLVIKMGIALVAQAVYEGNSAVIIGLEKELGEIVNQEKSLLNQKKLAEEQNTAEKTRASQRLVEEQNTLVYENFQKNYSVKKGIEQYLIEGAENLLRESIADQLAGLIFGLTITLPGGATVFTPLERPEAKAIGGNEARIIPGNTPLERTVSELRAGIVNSNVLLQWNQTVQLVVPIYITDAGQPKATIQLNSEQANAIRNGPGGEKARYGQGVYAYDVELGVQQMVLNYTIDKGA